MCRRFPRDVSVTIFLICMSLTSPSHSGAATNTAALNIQNSRVTGNATFVTSSNGNSIPLDSNLQRIQPTPRDFLKQYGHVFGISNLDAELIESAASTDSIGAKHTTFLQLHHGVSVFSGILKTHQNAQGDFIAANGDFYPISQKLNVVASLTSIKAIVLAKALLDTEQPTVETSELVIVDPGWYGDPAIGAHLAYYIVLADRSVPLRQAFFVDAHSGLILDQWNLLHNALDRQVTDDVLGALVRSEGDPQTGDFDSDVVYDYMGDMYGYLFRALGRDGIDDNGGTLNALVHWQSAICPNAVGDASGISICTGVTGDDTIAHEMGHGLTQVTANLIYQNQSGQLNESYSDVWGELIDLLNGDTINPGPPAGTTWPKDANYLSSGQDTPNFLRTICSVDPMYLDGVRWLHGEDDIAFGGAIRDMWQPTCMGDPDRANHPFQTCSPNDNGGVHSGSGVPNHAFAMLSDGKTFNGQVVNGIGAIKAGAVWYRALTVYLTVASDFTDAYFALNQAAADLVGTNIFDPRDGSILGTFTLADAAEVDKALQAVEMNTEGACGASVPVLDSTPPVRCSLQVPIFEDDFEGGINGWTVSNTGPNGPPTPYDWIQLSSGLPFGHSGTVWFADDPNLGDCITIDESAVHSLFSPVIVLPAEIPFPVVEFTHYVETEIGFDGGNIKISINSNAWSVIPDEVFQFNPYNATINTFAADDNTNPLEGQRGWTGAGGRWGTSLIELTSLVAPGDSVQFRFDFGKDGCTGFKGWYVDDFKLYTCPLDCNSNGIPDDVDLSIMTSLDCNVNNIPDECDLSNGTSFDCNENTIPDDCEIADMPSLDGDGNSVLDECEFVPCLMNELIAHDADSEDRFGVIGIDDPYLAVGAPDEDSITSDSGSVYMYRKVGLGWQFQSKLVASDGRFRDGFGSSIAISSDTLVVGARAHDVDTSNDAGAVYVFQRQENSWIQTQKLIASDVSAFANFGSALSLKGDYLAVGAPSSSSGTDVGAVYVYHRSGGIWSEQAIVQSPNFQAQFGISIAIDDMNLLIGAPRVDHLGRTDSGVVFAYRRTGTAWLEIAMLASSDSNNNDKFGTEISLDGSLAAIGSPFADVSGQNSVGAVYVWQLQSATWLEQAKLVPSTAQSNASCSLGQLIDGNIIVSYGTDVGGVFARVGQLFQQSGASWIPTQLFVAPIVTSSRTGWFEQSALSNGYAAFGAPLQDVTGGFNQGATYIYAALTPDCDASGALDICESFGGIITDCNNNGIPDQCDPNEDCNTNMLVDICEIASGELEDCNGNLLVDACEAIADCNSNTIPDECDTDCNANSVPDDCEGFADCNTNGIPDECDTDCNNNFIPDECEAITDCNSNIIPDECELILNDCNSNGIPDDCEASGNDCNGDGRLDECEPDCNNNGTPDPCELVADCNSNGTLDACELISNDCDSNGIPDDCSVASPSCTPEWDTLPGNPGMDNFVNEFIVYDDGSGPALYAAGSFGSIGSQGIGKIAKWNGVAWTSLNIDYNCNGGANGDSISVMTKYDDGAKTVLVLGGSISTVACQPNQNDIVTWDGNSWQTIGNGVDASVFGLAVFDSGSGPDLYVGGSFDRTFGPGGGDVDFIAKWDGAAWSPLISSGSDGIIPTAVGEMVVFDDGAGQALFVAGDFISNGDAIANGIAKWDGTSWHALGTGIRGHNAGVGALVVFDDGTGDALYVGGTFRDAGDIFVNSIAKWNGVEWLPVGDGFLDDIGFTGQVRTLEVYNDGTGTALYAGGVFAASGTTNVSNIAKWNGISWEPVGAGSDTVINDLISFNDFCSSSVLFAGGGFSTMDGDPANRVAKWGCRDCNANGITDAVDVANGNADCNNNLIPDLCEPDCDGDSTPDSCEITSCVPGDLTCADCSGNGIPDGCEVPPLCPTCLDCNTNGIPDDCEEDCNGNSIPDECDISAVTSPDCNSNGIPDECDVSNCSGGDVACEDCDGNGIANECDIANGASDDNINGIPDRCEIARPKSPVAPFNITKDRYLSFDPNNNTGILAAFRVTRIGASTSWYISCTLQNDGAQGMLSELVQLPEYCLWSDTVIHIRGCEIVPGNEYLLDATLDNISFTSPLSLLTTSPQNGANRQFGDLVGSFINGAWSSPEGLVTASDIVAVVQKFQLSASAPHISRVDCDGKTPNGIVAGNDILREVIAFAGGDFGFGVTDCLTGTCVPNCP